MKGYSLRYKLFFLFILLLPMTSLGRLEIIKPSEILMMCLILIHFFDFTMQNPSGRKRGVPTAMAAYLIFFVFYLALTSLISPALPEEVYNYSWFSGFFSENQGLLYLLRIFFLVMTFFALMKLINKDEHLMLAIKFIMISAMIYFIMIFVVTLIKPSLVFTLRENTWEIFPFRMKGFASEPNSFCAWLYSVFFLFLTLSYFKNEVGISQKLIRLFTGIIIFSLIFTFSTTGYFAVFFGLLFFYKNKRRIWPKVIKMDMSLRALKVLFIVYVIAASSILLWKYVVLFLNAVPGKITVLATLSQMDPRSILLVTNVNTFLHYPLFGVGIGRSGYFAKVFYPFDSITPLFQPDESIFRSMCTYTLILCETGIVGFLIIGVIFARLIKYCRYKGLSLKGKIISLYSVSSLVVYMVGMIGSSDIQFQLYFVLTVVLLIRNYELNQVENSETNDG